MQFEDIGVFLSFVSYPFYKDGKDLYNDVFLPFFDKHKKHIATYDPDAVPGEDPYPNIYTPAGYRMFSSSGLAILSLVDDYSFYNRFFNKNHIHSLLQPEDTKENNDGRNRIDLDFKSVVISGITEREESERTLLESAKSTFLLPDNNRYRYIGIIRLKIDYRLLVGKEHAMATVSSIKKQIKFLYDNRANRTSRCDYIAIDCYDNDELTVIAFADELLTLFNLLGNIRSIKNTDINQPYFDKGKRKNYEKHVFGLTYLCFGYDLKLGLGDDIGTNNMIHCTVETKPGHRDIFYSYLLDNQKTKSLEISNPIVNISGGCTICFTMPLHNIAKLENVCKDTKSVFRRDVRKVKVSLIDNFESSERDKCTIAESEHVHTNDDKQVEINRGVLSSVKELMKQAGVSKMVRERLMALFEFYNLSCQNILQSFYLEELKPAMSDYYNMIADMQSNPKENLSSIEKMLNEEITNMENACYDRLHIQKNNQPPLEYSGGIQQYLTSFDFAYKQIYRIFSPKDNDAFYITITGAERAASERQLFKLNIHDIIFPELFITTVWKEIANFAIKIKKRSIEKDSTKPHKELIDTLNTWNDFVTNKDAFRIIRDRIHQSEKLLHDDDVSRRIKQIVSPELLEYFIKDSVVFHFAFCGNYSMFWHFYFKILLQTTNCYNQLNHINKENLIHMLLRVFMIAKLASRGETDKELSSFLRNQANAPFDSILSAQWIECYNKTLMATDEIYDVLNVYGFTQMIDYTLESYEENIYKKENPGQLYNPKEISNNDVLTEREKVMKKMMKYLKKGWIVREDPNHDHFEYSFLICLFGAFLRSVYELDYSINVNCPIKSIPRDITGKINEVMEIKPGTKNEMYDKLLRIPVDTTGGFFIPSFTARKQYFLLRTTLYRSMWNYRFACLNQ